VIHDHTLERTTNGRGRVGARTLGELQKLDAGAGERIPALEEVLELARGRVGVAIEIKSLPILYPGIEARLLETLREARMTDECAVICFDHRVVRRLHDLEPGLVLGVLIAGRPLLLPELLEYAGASVYSPHWSYCDVDTVAEVHACGAVVGVWTVDDAATLDACLAMGVDAVYTNRPREILAALAEPPPAGAG